MDLIDRQAAIDELKREASCGDRDYEKGLNIAADILELLPSAPADYDLYIENESMWKLIHKRVINGEWIRIAELLDSERCKCSQCGGEVLLNDRNRRNYSFCPNCGSYNGGGA